ncbi:MAG: WYL domain-containing protein [Clostridia bacterium]|nr:WYL domain-containing protein [Clostridia bacterium]
MSTLAVKAFQILNILNSYTDEDHPQNATEILEKLTSMGIETERRSIYRCISALEDAGYDIVKSGKSGWFIGKRQMETAELKILMDAVQQAHFLTERKSIELLDKLMGLTSTSIAHELKKQISVSKRSKHGNESIYYNVDKINTAIVKNKQLTFQYFQYDEQGQRVLSRNGYRYRVSPYFTTWYAENYYMICTTKEYSNFSHYRIEKMTEIEISDKKRRPLRDLAPNGFNLAEYLNKTVSMFTGTPEKIRLRIDTSLASQIFDKFGMDQHLIPDSDGKLILNVDAVVEKGLLSWIISYGDKIEVLSPDSLRNMITEHCSNIIELYR